jgi:hypothetical protein
MQTHPALANAARGDRGPRLDTVFAILLGDRFDPIPESSPRRACLRPGRNPRADGRGAQQREQRIVLRKPILALLLSRRLETSPDPPRGPGQHASHVVGFGWIERMKATRRTRCPLVDAVENQRMEMWRQVESRTEALNERDRAAQTAADPEVSLRPSSLIRKQSTQETAQHVTRKSRVPSATVSERIGKREHPLPDRDLGQYAVDEMGSGFGHAPSAARGTESSPLARKGHEPIVATGVAVDAQEAMGEHAALELGTNLALDEASDGSTRGSGAREERLQIFSDDAMEERLLGLVAFVAN